MQKRKGWIATQRMVLLLGASALVLLASVKAEAQTYETDVTTDTTLNSPVVVPPGYTQVTYGIGNNATLTLGPGSDPTSTFYVKALAGGGQLVNNASITSTGAAIAHDGFNFTAALSVVNNGTIRSAVSSGQYVIKVGSYGLTGLSNTGTITASGAGGAVDADANYSFNNSGLVTADGTAVYAFDNVVTNSGTIYSNYGIGFYGLGNVGTPSSNSGSIYGEAAGARLSGYKLTNSGVITSPGIAVLFDSYGTLINAEGGRVEGDVGVPISDATFHAGLDNAGTIDGNVNFGDGLGMVSQNLVILRPGGEINGNLVLGSGGDTFATNLINAGPGQFSGVTGTVTGGSEGSNTLHYFVTSDASLSALGPPGLFGSFSYDLSNDAKLVLTPGDIPVNFLTFEGTGTVDLTANITAASGMTVLDLTRESLQPTADPNVFVPTILDFTSYGGISGIRNISYSWQPLVLLSGSSKFTNAGTIVAADASPDVNQRLIAIQGNGTVVNTGTISLLNSDGIDLATSGGSLAVTNSGQIVAASGDSSSRGISNAATVVNTGMISTGGWGVIFLPGAHTLTNSGQISSENDVAVLAFGDTTIINQLGGTLSGATYGVQFNSFGNEIVNAGTIAGATDSIIGSDFNPFKLTLQTGSSLLGDVLGGQRATNILILQGSGSEDSKFLNFTALDMQGPGTWVLSGDSTITAISVSAGTLSVNGSIASSSGVTVQSGGTLGGTGTVSTTLVQSGGVLAPGNSIGTLAVSGNLTFQSGATYAVEVDQTSADKTLVSGNASLAGSLFANFATGGGYSATAYTLLTATGALSGSFSSFDTLGLPRGFRADVSYDSRNVFLTLTPNLSVWSAGPANGDWNTSANWTNGQVPDAGSTAEFSVSTVTQVSVAGAAQASTIQLDSDAPAYSFAITGGASGAASLTLSEGVMQLSANNASFTASGAGANTGTLAFAGTGNAAGSVLTAGSGGIVSFASNSDAGAGAALVAGSGGTIDFSATSGAAGDHQVSAGSIAGAGRFVLGANTLMVGALGTSTEVAGVISGSGGLVKTGGSTLLLSGINTYTGPTTVNAGVLDVNGSLASGVTLAGGELKGHGAVGGVTVSNGATVAPGNSIGTLNTGSISFAPGSTYQVEVNAAGQSDLINASGGASLNGTVAVQPAAGNYAPLTTYRILNAGSISGTFAAVTSSDASLTPSLTYGATAVDLTLLRTNLAFGTAYGSTPNQMAAGNAVGGGASSPLYVALADAYAPATIGATLDAMSGEIHASLRSAMIEDSRMIRDGVLDRLAGGETGAWARGFADYGELDGNGNASDLHRGNAGFVAGLDLPLGNGFRAGIAGAYTSQHVWARDSLARGDSGHVIGYAGWRGDAWMIDAGGAYGWGSNDIIRSVAALSERESDSQDSRTGQVFARVSYDAGLPVVPYAGLAHVSAETGAFAETGGLAALSGAGNSDSQTYTALGARMRLSDLHLGKMGLDINADLGWSHALDDRVPGQVLAYANGQSFTVLGVPVGADAATLQLGLDLAIAPSATLHFGYDGSFSGSSTSNAITGGLDWRL